MHGTSIKWRFRYSQARDKPATPIQTSKKKKGSETIQYTIGTAQQIHEAQVKADSTIKDTLKQMCVY
jgi:hypothetical protein